MARSVISAKIEVVRKVFIIAGGLSLGATVIAGGGIVAYRQYQIQQAPQVASGTEGGSVGLSLTPAGGNRSVPVDGSSNNGKTINLSDKSSADSNGNILQSNAKGANGTSTSSAAASPSKVTMPTPDKLKDFEQYKDAQSAMFGEIELGSGPEAGMNKKITVNYRGWLTDGREFDESYARGKPFSFVIGQHQVILGWEQGILGMKVGGKRILIIPPAVGYGTHETNGIPANSVLVFQVELLGVE